MIDQPRDSARAPRDVLLFLFDDVEVFDFAGPFEVFSACGRLRSVAPFRVRTVGRTGGAVRAQNGLTIVPDLSLAQVADGAEVLIVPGGVGTRALIADPLTLDWIAAVAPRAEITLSVCTGALLLGAAGLLRGLRATTHHAAFGELRDVAPEARILEHAQIVDNGAIVTASGISAGIDAALHVVARLEGHACAVETAHYMAYDWVPRRGLVEPPSAAAA